MAHPKAQIVYWNAIDVVLKCPYCAGEESQKFLGYDAQTLEATCGAGVYLVEFPLNGAWELDKSAGRYVEATSAHEVNGNADGEAILKRPAPFSLVVQDKSDNVEKVLEVAQAVRHRFSSRQTALHVEKQLLMKFLDLHVWLAEEITVDKQLKKDVEQMNMKYWWFKSSSAVVRQYEILQEEAEQDTQESDARHQQIEEFRRKSDVQNYERQKNQLETKQALLRQQQKFFELSGITPPNGLKEAVIQMTSPDHVVCDDCKRFVENVNNAYGLNIKLQSG